MTRPSLPVFGLFCLAFFASWLLWKSVLQAGIEKPADPATPDAFAKQLVLRVFDEKGQLFCEFFSPFSHHYQKNNRMTLDKPTAFFYETDKTSLWKLTALRGESFMLNQKIYLTGGVTLVQTDKASFQKILAIFRTPTVTIFPKKQLMFTPDDFEGQKGFFSFQGKGLQIDNVHHTLYVYADVKAIGRFPHKLPVNLQSDHAALDTVKHQGKFSGHVLLKQGKNQLETPQLFFDLDQKNQDIIKFSAKASDGTVPFFKIDRSEISHNAASVRDTGLTPLVFSGTAEKIDYFPAQNSVHLWGHAVIMQGPNRYISPDIVYDLDKQTVVTKKGPVMLKVLPSAIKQDWR